MAITILAVSLISFSTAGRSIAAEALGVVDDTKQNKTAPPASEADLAKCHAEWTKADLNKNGVLDPDEASVYAAALDVEHKPAVTDTNLNEAGFLRECESLTAHE
jgi:hypothetical protein